MLNNEVNPFDVTDDKMHVHIQSQEGGGPGHQRGSSTGAAGPGHEPQPAHLSGPGCRPYPGEGSMPFLKLDFVSVSSLPITLLVLTHLVKH